MPIKSLFLFFLLLLNFNLQTLNAQDVYIQGNVKKKDSTAIENASVIAYNDNSIITYSYTKLDGTFSLKLNATGIDYVVITASSLGYIKKSDTIYLNLDKKKYELALILAESYEQLNEVVINSDEKIVRENDKFIYNVDKFTNDTEQTVEDVLKKLPGIEVLEDGSIKAHGRYIDKLLIEGEDMFDKNYKMLSKNLDAKVLSKVEILEGFEDNPVLAKVLSSTKVGINLVFKEDYKNIWFGNISLGAGTKNRFSLSSNLGLIRKNIKFFNFNQYNNLGNHAAEQMSSNRANYDDSDYSNVNDYKINPIYELPEPQIGFFRNNEATFNTAFINALSFVKKINSKLKIRGTGFFLKDNEDFFSESKTIFNLNDSNLIYNEENKLSYKEPLIGGNIEIKYYNNNNSYIENDLKITNTSNQANQNLLFNENFINEDLSTQQLSFFNHFNYTLLIKKKLIHNYLYFGSNYLDQNLDLISPTLNTILSQSANSSVRNIADDQTKIIGGKSSMLINIGKIENTVELGYESLNEIRNNTFKLGNNSEIDTLQNTLNYKQNKLVLDSRLNYKISKKINLYGSLSFNYLKLKNNLEQINTLIVNPKIGLRLKNLKIGTFNFQYQKDYLTPQSNSFLSNYQLSNYQSFTKGNSSIFYTRRNKYKFIYNISNELKTQVFSISTQFIESDGRYSSRNLIDENFSFSTLEFVRGGDVLISKIDITSYFKRQKVSTNLGLLINNSNIPLLLNASNFSNLNLNSTTYFLTGRTYFNSPINFNFKLSLTKNKSEFNNIVSKANWKSSSLNVNYKLSDVFTASLKNKLYYLANGNYSFVNLEVNFNPKKSRFSYRLLLNNLTNENKFIIDNVDEISSYSSQIRLLPRFGFLELKYRI